MLITTLALHGFLLGEAQAQAPTGFDAHGPALPPDGADVRDPALGLGGARTGAPVVSIYGHAASATVVERLAQGPNVDDSLLVGSLVGSELAFQTGIYGPVGVSVSLPLWFLSGGTEGGALALGDAVLWVPVELIDRDEDLGLRFGFSPLLKLPTGATARYLGDPGVGGGLLATGAWRRGPVFANADLGFDVAPETGVDEWPGGLHWRWALDGGVAPTDTWAVHGEYRGRIPSASAAPSLPSELMATFKVKPQERYWLDASVGTALTRGPGASALRVLLGVTFAPGTQDVEEEIVAAPPPKEIQVVDYKGLPISGATVMAGGVEVVTDLEGYADMPIRAIRGGGKELVVEHPHFETTTVAELDPDAPFYTVELDRSPVPVLISVVGPAGALLEVDVEVDGPYDPGPPVINEAGVHEWALRQGSWFVRMSSPGLGTQERTIVIQESRVDPIRVDAVLASAVASSNRVRVEVVDRLGRPVEDAVVALENRDLGTTGTGGDLTVEGLQAGLAELTIRSDRFGDKSKLQLVIDETGEQTVQAVVDWRPGSVQVAAVDPKGRPIDAQVNFIGPANLPPRDTGTDGEEIFVVRPGTWNVEISAPGLGTQIRTIEVTDEAGELVQLDVAMQADEGGPAEVRLRVRDVEGNAVQGAEVVLDGKSLGVTGPQGDVAVRGLETGRREFEIKGEMIEGGSKTVELVAGNQVADATVKWVDGVVDVTAVDVNGTPVDAKISITGPGKAPAPEQIGTDGRQQVQLGAGEWEITAEVPGYAPQTRKVVVGEGEGRREEARFKLAPEGEVATVAVKVVGPDGKEVKGAVVEFDGDVIGEADEGELVADGVAVGPVLVGAVAEGMRAKSVGTAVMQDEENVVEVPLEWAPGAMEVQITGPDGEPVDARVTLRGPDGTMPIDPRAVVDGEAVIGAQPGQWTMVVEAEGMRTEVIDVDLSEDPELTTVPVAMKAQGGGDSPVVLVRAENARGDAIANAEVKVDGKVVGTTTAAGTFELVELPDDDFVVTVESPDEEMYDDIEIPVEISRKALKANEEVQAAVILPDAAQEVQVVVQNAEGDEVKAEIVAIKGADEADAVEIDPGEKGSMKLRPGAYTITAMTEDGSLATTDIIVPDRDPNSGGELRTYIPGADQQGLSADGLSIVELENGMPIVSLRVEQVSAAMSDGMVVPVNPILFNTGQATLREDALPLVRDLARWLTAHREAALVEVGGHTDDVGGVVVNQQLSENRAATVKQALIDNGVAPERLRSRGYGLSRPVVRNIDDESRQRNRRVALVVLEWNE